MVKQEIIGYILGFLPQNDATQQFHPRWVEAVIEKVIIEMYQDLFKINPRLLDKYTKQYGIVDAIGIGQEAGSLLYLSFLPVGVVSLPDAASGVRHIYPMAQTGNVFVPMDAREADIVFGTDVAIVSSKIGYRVRQDDRVDYWNMNNTLRNTNLRMDLLIPFSTYLDDDVVQIPELSEKEGGTFVQRCLKVLGVVPEADLSDDNAPPENQQKAK